MCQHWTAMSVNISNVALSCFFFCVSLWVCIYIYINCQNVIKYYMHRLFIQYKVTAKLAVSKRFHKQTFIVAKFCKLIFFFFSSNSFC